MKAHPRTVTIRALNPPYAFRSDLAVVNAQYAISVENSAIECHQGRAGEMVSLAGSSRPRSPPDGPRAEPLRSGGGQLDRPQPRLARIRRLFRSLQEPTMAPPGLRSVHMSAHLLWMARWEVQCPPPLSGVEWILCLRCGRPVRGASRCPSSFRSRAEPCRERTYLLLASSITTSEKGITTAPGFVPLPAIEETAV